MHFDFVDLRLIVYIGESHNLARAAERCHLSAPAASSRVKNLEARIGTPLLYRSSQGVTLTPAGNAFHHHAQSVLDQIEHLASDMQDYAHGLKGHVRIWANTSAISEFLPATLSDFLCAYPDVNIDLREMPSGEIVRGVAVSSTDIGIVAGNVDTGDLEMLPYRDDRLVLVTASNHPLANSASLEFANIVHENFVILAPSSAIHPFLVNAAKAVGARLKLRIQVSNFEAMCRMIEANVGVGILPQSSAFRHASTMKIATIPLIDAWAERRLNICVRSLASLAPFARELVNRLSIAGASLPS